VRIGVVNEYGFKACDAPPRFDSVDLRAVEGTDGHTLRRHVGKTDDQLRDRALRTHHDVSCFNDAATAQVVVDEAVAENQNRIGRWLNGHRNGNLPLHVHCDAEVGRVFRYGAERIELSSDADVILERRPQMPQGFTVITAFPEEVS
jgi:hypothetical protein